MAVDACAVESLSRRGNFSSSAVASRLTLGKDERLSKGAEPNYIGIVNGFITLLESVKKPHFKASHSTYEAPPSTTMFAPVM